MPDSSSNSGNHLPRRKAGDPTTGAGDPDMDMELEWEEEIPHAVVKPNWRRVRSIPEPAAQPAELPPIPESRQKPLPEKKGAHGNRVPMEKKNGLEARPFTRQTTHRGENPAMEAPAPAAAPKGAVPFRNRTPEGVDFTPNRLQTVLNETWVHAPLTWIDRLHSLRTVALWGVLAVLMAGLMGMFGREVWRQQADQLASTPAAAPLPSDEERRNNIRKSFEAFRAAGTPEKKVAWVLDPQRVLPRMQVFYNVWKEKEPEVDSFEVGEPLRAGPEWWFPLVCQSPDGKETTVMMKETPEGGQLDWENYVAYGSMPWEKFHQSRPVASQTLRTRIRISDQYAGKYEPVEFIACEIAHRTGPPVIYGYALRSSPAGVELAGLPVDGQWQFAHLHLRWETDAGAENCVEVAEVLRDNWLDGAANTSNGPMPLTMDSTNDFPEIPVVK